MAFYRSNFFHPLLLSILLMTGMGAIACSAKADDITPSHVYQDTETLRLQLDALGVLTESSEQEDTLALRHPRHVMQKVRECNMLIAKLIQEKGKEAAPLPPLFSLREIRPSDVQNGVRHLISEIQKIGADQTIHALFEEKKLPTDVYSNLSKTCRTLSTEIIPSDVYQIAKAVRNNMEKIARARGYNIDIVEMPFQIKWPRDVYMEGWSFLEDIRLLALIPDYAIPGGVLLPKKIVKDQFLPRDVITVMNDALSETEAIKYTLGIGEESDLPHYVEEKTPSDVFGQIYSAHRIAKEIMNQERSLQHKYTTP